MGNLKQILDVYVSKKLLTVDVLDDLYLYNYTSEVQFHHKWDEYTKMARGIILNSNGDIVARPFRKFYNFNEVDETALLNLPNEKPEVSVKMDGSLGILFKHNGEHKITTRGKFTSEQSVVANQILQEKYSNTNFDLYKQYTLLFEIIYPENKVVVDYGEQEELYLLAIRDRFTGEYLSSNIIENVFDCWEFPATRCYNFSSIDNIISETKVIDLNQEGWVVEFEDGQRFKFKGEEYKRLHKLITGLSFKWALENYHNGTIEKARTIIPEEFHEDLDRWVEEIEDKIYEIENRVNDAFYLAPKTTRKEFALWVMENHKDLAPYLFAKIDNRDIEPLILKQEFKNRSE